MHFAHIEKKVQPMIVTIKTIKVIIIIIIIIIIEGIVMATIFMHKKNLVKS
jgi:hypothetical protein